MRTIILLLAMLFPLTSWAGFEGTSIDGKIQKSKGCGEQAEVFVSLEKTLLFQATVPTNGNFRFHVVPGKYKFAALDDKGCFYEKEITVDADKQALKITLWNKKDRTPSSSMMAAPMWDVYGGTATYYAYQNLYWMQMSQRYRNFYYPGAWAYNAFVPMYYPGWGTVGIGKPNLYFSTKSKLKVSVKVEYPNDRSRWLASIPAYDKTGWQIETSGDGKIKSAGVDYGYLFYDFRDDDKEMQNAEGFCEPRNLAIDKMISILKEMKFAKNEISDFEVYWKIKMPPTKELCVFPQTKKQMDKISQLKIEPAPRTVSRVVFVVIPKDEKKFYALGKFQAPPEKPWVAPKDDKVENFKNDLNVREWGVAFMFNPE